MSKFKVDITGINTNEIAVLSSKQMEELFRKLSLGEKDARNILINGNLKLILSILKKINTKSENLDDLFQIGCIGLIKAIDNFDPTYNVKFSTYAVPMISGEIKRYIRDNNSIRVSRSVKEIAYKILKYQDEYLANTGREIPMDKLSDELNLSEYEIMNALDALKEPVSIYEPVFCDVGDEILLCDQIEDKKVNSEEISKKMILNNAIKNLDKRENKILNERYIFGNTQSEIAKMLEISQAQVSRIEKKAIKKLKKVMR